MKLLKFCGDFKKLNDLGYSFGKYFAKNYKAYTLKEGKYTNLLHIWVAEKDIEIENHPSILNLPMYNYINSTSKEEILKLEKETRRLFPYKLENGVLTKITHKEHFEISFKQEQYNLYHLMKNEDRTKYDLKEKKFYILLLLKVRKYDQKLIEGCKVFKLNYKTVESLVYLNENKMLELVNKKKD